MEKMKESKSSKVLGILSIVLGLFMPIVGIILGIIGLCLPGRRVVLNIVGIVLSIVSWMFYAFLWFIMLGVM